MAWVVARLNRSAGLVENDDIPRGLREAEHVVAEACDLRGQLRLAPRGIGILRRVCAGRPALQLTASNRAEVHVVHSIVVLKDGRIDAEATRDGLRLGSEGTFGVVPDCYADPEDVLSVLGREVKEVLAI